MILCFAAASLAACGRIEPSLELHGSAMGTTYSVFVSKPPSDVGRQDLQRTIDAQLADVNAHLSTYDASSEISSFNGSASTDWIPASRQLAAVIRASLEICRQSGGVFDVTIGPVVAAWGFGAARKEQQAEPGPDEFAAWRAAVGMDKLELRDTPLAIRKASPDVRLDVDGIAPGYAVDELARRLRALGVDSALVEIGGEVTAFGRSPSGRPWRIAVEEPLSGERRPHAIVELEDASISTSGDYRDFRFVDGRRVSHTIDPRSGLPVRHELASVSVIHESAMYADGYATALTVLGPQEGPALAERLGLAALFLVRDPATGGIREISTPEFAKYRRPLL